MYYFFPSNTDAIMDVAVVELSAFFTLFALLNVNQFHAIKQRHQFISTWFSLETGHNFHISSGFRPFNGNYVSFISYCAHTHKGRSLNDKKMKNYCKYVKINAIQCSVGLEPHSFLPLYRTQLLRVLHVTHFVWTRISLLCVFLVCEPSYNCYWFDFIVEGILSRKKWTSKLRCNQSY